MSEVTETIWRGLYSTLATWPYRLIFAVTFIIFFSLLLVLPVIIQTGGTDNFVYTLQGVLSFLRPSDYLIITVLSLLYALFIPMQIFAFRQKKQYREVGTAAGGALSTLFAGIVGTAFCSSCLAPLLGLFGIGFGGVLFVLQYRFYFVLGAIIIMLTAIYYTARKINNVCITC